MRSLALVCWVFLVAGCKRQEPRLPQVPPPDPRQDIIINEADISYNGKPLALNTRLDKWENVLGPPSRHYERFHTWDELGVEVCQFEYGDDRIAEFSVILRLRPPERTIEHWPYKPFQDRVIVDGGWVHKDIKPWQIRKKPPLFKDSYLPTIFDYRTDTVPYVAVRLDTDQQGWPYVLSLGLMPGLKEEAGIPRRVPPSQPK